jgi:hypothetical protein
MIKTMLDTAIDAVQTSKKIFVDTFVKHEGLATSLNTFVDAQTEYTKKAVETTINAGNDLYKTVTDKSFYRDLSKSAQESVKTIFPNKVKQ